MGADYYAQTMIGVSWEYEEIFKEKAYEVRGCEHKETDSLFCSECGAPIRVEKVDKINRLGPSFDGGDKWTGPSGEEWDVQYTTDRGNILIGRGITCGGWNGESMSVLDADSIDDTYGKLKSDLTAAGLWDDDLFGIWGSIHCSY